MRLILFIFTINFTFFTSLSIFTLITDNLFIGAFQLVITSLIGAIAWFLVHLFKQIELHSTQISSIQLKIALLENNYKFITGSAPIHYPYTQHPFDPDCRQASKNDETN